MNMKGVSSMSRTIDNLPEEQLKLVTDLIFDLNLTSIVHADEMNLLATGLLHKRLNLISEYILLDDRLQGGYSSIVYNKESVRPERPKCKEYKNEREVIPEDSNKSWWKKVLSWFK